MSATYIEEGFILPSSSAFRIETPEGFVIVDRGLKMKPGDEVAFQYDGYPIVVASILCGWKPNRI